MTMIKWLAVKAVGEWELDVLGVPYGGPEAKDAQGEFFDAATDLGEGRFGLPPVVYYHGFTPEGQPAGMPEYIGRAVSSRKESDGVWYRVVLDKASALAKRVWESARAGLARASSGSIGHLVRREAGGHIRHWPVVELSLFDAVEGRRPANNYAVAVPVAKAVYEAAGLPLPDIETEPEAGPEGEQSRGGAGAMSLDGETDRNREATMEPNDVKTLIAEAIAADRAEAAKAAQEKAAFDAAVKAEVEKVTKANETEIAARRLPGGVPFVAKFNDRKFDHMDVADHALMIGILQNSVRKGRGQAPSDLAVKSLAGKLSADKSPDPEAFGALKAVMPEAMKANEVGYSTLANYGDEWVGVAYSNRIWEKVRANTFVLSKLESAGSMMQIADGFESETIPLEGTDLSWYKVAQATAHTSGRPDVTVTASKLGTANKSITLAKLGARGTYSGELVEDSLAPYIAAIRRSIEVGAAEMIEHAIIDGDTATAGTTNINDIGGTPAGTEVFMLLDGFRKLALVTNTANSRDGGALASGDFLETIKLMGIAGVSGSDPNRVSFICDPWTYFKAMELADVKTRDVYMSPTIESGKLTSVYGYGINPSWFMHYAGVAMGTVTTASYQLKASSAGKVNQDTESANTLGALLAVRWDQWKFAWKRRLTIEVDRWPESDTNQIVAMARFGLGYRDTEASAISYNLTV